MRNGGSVTKPVFQDDDPGGDLCRGAEVLCEAMQETESGQSDASAHEGTRPEIIGLALVAIAIGIVTRFVTRSSLWLDEALSVNLASLPLGELSEALKHDGHPPFYYVLLEGMYVLFVILVATSLERKHITHTDVVPVR